MIYLVDTNVLLRITQSDDSRHQIAQDAGQKLEVEGHQLTRCKPYFCFSTRSHSLTNVSTSLPVSSASFRMNS